MLRGIETRWVFAKPKGMSKSWGTQPCIRPTIHYGDQHNIIKGEIVYIQLHPTLIFYDYKCCLSWKSLIPY
jgi:hypothetical protein